MPTDSDTLDTLKRQHWTSVIGLLWGVVALGLWTGWLYVFTRSWEGLTPPVILGGVLTLTLLALAGWQAQVGLSARRAPAAAEGILHRQRRAVAFVLFAVAIVLLLLVIWLASQQGFVASFPEFSSGLVLTLIGLGAGIALLVEPRAEWTQERLLQGLIARRQVLMVALGIAGIAFAALAVSLWLLLEFRPAFPEIVASVLVGLVLLGGAAFLFGYAGMPLGPAEMRSLVLTVGGLVGLVIALLAIIRAWVWWNEVFAAGITAWRGEQAWRLWACFYGELLGLAIIFGSLLLGRADIRVNPTLRRLLFGYNTVLTGLLLLAVLVVFNVTVYACYPYTFEWTKAGLYSLSEQSKNTLNALQEPVTIYVLMSERQEVYQDVHTLLQNVQSYTNRVQVEYVAPDLQPKYYKTLVERFPKLTAENRAGGGRGLLIVYGADTGKGPPPPNAFIPAASLSGDTPVGEGGVAREFKGESLLMTELRFLAKGGMRPTVYFTQDNGEYDIANSTTRNGAGLFVEYLRTQRYEVKGLKWGPPELKAPGELSVYAKEVPKDAMAVVISRPTTPFSKEALAALGKYLDGKGKLLYLSNILYDPNNYTLVETGLEDFLRKYGVEVGRGYLLHIPTQRGDVPIVSQAVTPAESNNPIALRFKDFPILVERARPIRPLPGAGGYRGEVILEVGPPYTRLFWEETDLKTLANVVAYSNSLIQDPQEVFKRASRKPIPVGVAVTSRKDQPTLVAYGDATMASNEGDPQVSRNPFYYPLMVSSLEWLAGRPENIGIPPRKSNYYSVPPEKISFQGLVLLPTGLILLGLLGFGAGVWVVRRR
jgi:hypothetical protein